VRHRRRGRKLNRTSSHRRALLRNLTRALILSKGGRIVTTVAKAKEATPFAAKLVTLARRGDLASRRRALAILPDPGAIRRLFGEIAPAMKDRPGGYTRVLKLGGEQGPFRARRVGDAAPRALWLWTDRVGEGQEPSSDKKKEKGKEKDAGDRAFRKKAQKEAVAAAT
jgi:large subunit ribosomal protein L17